MEGLIGLLVIGLIIVSLAGKRGGKAGKQGRRHRGGDRPVARDSSRLARGGRHSREQEAIRNEGIEVRLDASVDDSAEPPRGSGLMIRRDSGSHRERRCGSETGGYWEACCMLAAA